MHNSISLRSRFRGCLLGGAVGDALGAPIEFQSRESIIKQYGEPGLTDYVPAYGRIGAITDDTQMTLFTAEGLLRAKVRSQLRGICHPPSVVAYSYLRWLQTQGESSALSVRTDGWLYSHTALHHRRAPGNTCLSALKNMRSIGQPAGNNSKGCGGIMRVAPIGLISATLDSVQPERDFALAMDIAALTHGHPTGQIAAGAFAALINLLIRGQPFTNALATVCSILRGHDFHQETLHAIDFAVELAGSGLPAVQAIKKLGQGWVAEEALAISLYCAMIAEDFTHGIILAINHDGDSDSTGAITGNLLGCMLGEEAIPAHWLEHLELRELIGEVAYDLHDCRQWVLGGQNTQQTQYIFDKYPGG